MNVVRKLAWILVIMVLGGCVGAPAAPDRIKRYLLEYDPPVFKELKPLDVVIRVDRFTAAPPYNQELMVYRDARFQRHTYYYHRWRVPPAVMLSDFVARDLRRSGLYRAVLRYDGRGRARFRLEGDLTQFLEEDREDGWYAVLAVEVILGDQGARDSSRWVVWQKSYRLRERCRGKGPQALVEAMSRAVAAFSRQLGRDLHHGVKARLAGKGP